MNGDEDHEDGLVLDEYRKVYRGQQNPDCDVNLAKHVAIGNVNAFCKAFGAKYWFQHAK